MSEKQRNDKLAEALWKLLQLPEDQREKVIEIVQRYPPQKINVALRIIETNVNKYLKRRKKITLEEFEEMLKRVRW